MRRVDLLLLTLCAVGCRTFRRRLLDPFVLGAVRELGQRSRRNRLIAFLLFQRQTQAWATYEVRLGGVCAATRRVHSI